MAAIFCFLTEKGWGEVFKNNNCEHAKRGLTDACTATTIVLFFNSKRTDSQLLSLDPRVPYSFRQFCISFIAFFVNDEQKKLDGV